MIERLRMCTKGTGDEVAAVSCLPSAVSCQSNNQTIKQSNNLKLSRGFTIVELMMVVGIIIILMGVVTTAAAQSIRASRARRAEALCTLVQAGMNAYYARNDEWPIDLAGKQNDNKEGDDGSADRNQYVLDGTEVRQCVRKLVEQTKDGNPVMDISGLYVSRSEGELLPGNKVKKAFGMDFMSAIHGTRSSENKMRTRDMYFGYPDPSTGYFLRFKMVYSIPTDQISVGKQRE